MAVQNITKTLYRITFDTQEYFAYANCFDDAIRNTVKDMALGRYSLSQWNGPYKNEAGHIEAQCRVKSSKTRVNFVIYAEAIEPKTY